MKKFLEKIDWAVVFAFLVLGLAFTSILWVSAIAWRQKGKVQPSPTPSIHANSLVPTAPSPTSIQFTG